MGEPAGAGPVGLARSVITAWALLGGIVLLALVGVNVVSIVGDALLGRPFPGDFELTEVGVAVAAFAFLPYCQLTGANVTADIFTAGASRRWLALFALAASLVALGFSLLLFWRMYFGMLDQKAYGYTTTILQFPHWIAFVAILISLALLAVASVITLAEAVRARRTA
jgi:TRAP-type C4-dicarboxylate transport system permease small subunit